MPEPGLGATAYCSCGATAGVKEKPHAKGCPNHPEQQKRGLERFLRAPQARTGIGPTEEDRDACSECGSKPGHYHTFKCSRFDETTDKGAIYGMSRTTYPRISAPEASPRSWSACPCGQPSRPGDDTRTNVYRGDELVELRYPHADGVQCCWTREMRR